MEDVQAACMVMEAELTKCRKTLDNVRKEYEFVFSGLKPSKDWIAHEMGRENYKYYRRNVVRQKVSDLVRGEVLPRELVIGYMLFWDLFQLYLIL